jgi:hypothetical protein
MKTKKTNKDDKETIRKAYEVAIADEPTAETQHPGFLPVFLFIEGDIKDLRNICLN